MTIALIGNARNRASTVFAALTIATAVCAESPAPNENAPDPHSEVRGVTISCPGSGRIWGTDSMVESLEELSELGVNWVAIHPYARISADGSVGGRYEGDTTWITRPIEEAHRLGLKIMIKPHLAYWGSPFSWRGEIAFDGEAEWERFFSTYQTWITRVAELSEGADAFVVGTELGGTVMHEQAWRRIIADVRAKTSVPLTYAANWDRFDKVPFWDAIDVIGIQGYFPLVNHDRLPSAGELDTAWVAHLARLEAYARDHRKPILFAELGYNRSAQAARRPWDYRQGGDGAEETQTRCLRAALRALDASDVVVGAFLWKWLPAYHHRETFLLNEPAIRVVIGEAWADRPASGPIGPATTER